MIKRTALLAFSSPLLLAALAFGCSSPTPEPKVEPEPTSAPPPKMTAEPTAEASAEPTAAPSSTSSTPPPSGRPGVSFAGAEKITNTFGASPSAKLELGSEGATLRIPEYALNDGVLITFMIDKKIKKGPKGGQGAVYRLQGQNPPSEAYATIVSRGPAFVLRLPTKIASPNLAIGETVVDEKGKETTTWKVVAPTKKDDGFATFEVSQFTNTMFQVTSDAPSGG